SRAAWSASASAMHPSLCPQQPVVNNMLIDGVAVCFVGFRATYTHRFVRMCYYSNVDDGAREVWALSDVELIARIDDCHAREQQAGFDRLAAIAEFEGRGLARQQGASSTTSWLRDRLRLASTTCHRLVELAKNLHNIAPATRQALADGGVNMEQAAA